MCRSILNIEFGIGAYLELLDYAVGVVVYMETHTSS
jgi:hypothetical protein